MPKQQASESQQKKSDQPNVKATTVVCPICGAKRGRRCVGNRRRPHPQRVRAARATHKKRVLQGRRLAAYKVKKWESVTIKYECPLCHGDHLRKDHDAAIHEAAVRQLEYAEETAWLLAHPVPGGLLDMARKAQGRVREPFWNG